jgi:hypothetical protein
MSRSILQVPLNLEYADLQRLRIQRRGWGGLEQRWRKWHNRSYDWEIGAIVGVSEGSERLLGVSRQSGSLRLNNGLGVSGIRNALGHGLATIRIRRKDVSAGSPVGRRISVRGEDTEGASPPQGHEKHRVTYKQIL